MDDVQVVVHAAGLAHDTRGTAAGVDDYTRVNAHGSMNAAAACARSGCRSLVLISSVKAMADRTSAVALTESDACSPTTPYGRSKLEGERLAKKALEGSGCRLAVVRLPPVYGPGSKGNLERLLEVARKGWMPLLPADVGGRSMVHVRDVASLVSAILDRQAAGTFIAEDGLHYTPRGIQQHARESLGMTGRTLAIPASPLRVALRLARRGQDLPVMRRIEADLARVVDRCLFDGTSTRRTLDWTPRRTLWEEMDHLLARPVP